MKKNRDFAALLLKKANQDALLVKKMADDPDVADDMIGFHFQQVVEKSLKAILVMKDIEFRKTHDIRELLDIISDNNLEIPSWFQELDAWTPFAVEYRYEELPDGPVYPVPRKDLAANAFSIIKFVEQQIS